MTPLLGSPSGKRQSQGPGQALPVFITTLLTLTQSTAEAWNWKISHYGLHCLVNKAKITPQNRSSQMSKWMNKESIFPDYYIEQMNLFLKCGKQNWLNHRHGYNFSLLSLRLPWCLDSKESTCNTGDSGLIPGLGRCPGEGNGYPLQYTCLEDLMDRGTWRATVHGFTKSRTQLKRPRTHARILSSQVTHMKQQCLHPQEEFSGRRQKMNSNPTPQKKTKPDLIWPKPSCVCGPSHPTRMVFCHIEWSSP